MIIRDDRRAAAVERMADHLLEEGLGAASLRSLAVAAGTSDRMLLYYFKDKDELLAATLEQIAGRLTQRLDAAVSPETSLPFPELLRTVWALMTSPEVQPFMHLWLDLAAGAARKLEPHREIAGRIADGFAPWIASRLRVEREAERTAQAARLLATIEGLMLLDAVGRRELAEAALSVN